MNEQDVFNEQYQAAIELRRPSVQFRPRVALDGNMWIALYGENLQEGVVGVGKTPELACLDFDKTWINGNHLTTTQSDPVQPPVTDAMETLLDAIEAGDDRYRESKIHGQEFWRNCIESAISPLITPPVPSGKGADHE